MIAAKELRMLASIAYLVTGVVFLILDATWLSLMANTYRRLMGAVVLDSFALAPAAVFYLLYVAGIVGFAVLPAVNNGGWTSAALRGACLGLVAYGTYDLTNQATLKAWPLQLTILDMAWGTVATSLTAALSALIVDRLLNGTPGA
jgi:uncharacterized membrane protein